MPPRTLASLAHALTVAPTTDAALYALTEALSEVDRTAQLALVTFDERRRMLGERRILQGEQVEVEDLATTFDHLPDAEGNRVAVGGQFVDLGEGSDDLAPLFQLPRMEEPAWISLRGIRFDGNLSAIIVLRESRKIFGSRTTERFAPSVALFELALLRLLERQARQEAVHTLEEVTQRVHDEYGRRLADLEQRLSQAAEVSQGAVDASQLVALERELADAREEARRAKRRAEAVDSTVGSAVEELEKAHLELHRRSEALRQKTRTLYLLDRVLTLDASTDDPRQLAEGLLSLVGDDMNAQRRSLMLRTPDKTGLYIAAAKGIAPGVLEGTRVSMDKGVAGRVATSRTPILVRDVSEANQHPLLRDQYFKTGSFISFPLVYHDELIGVVNLANRGAHGMFVEEDIDRVRLLGLVIALIASQSRLADRLIEAFSVT